LALPGVKTVLVWKAGVVSVSTTVFEGTERGSMITPGLARISTLTMEGER